MKNIKLLILLFSFLPLVGVAQALDFTTVTTPAFCVNDGSITVTATNAVGRVQYELVNYVAARSVIGVPQDSPVFLNLAPGTYTVGVYDDNNATTPITKEVIVDNNGSGKTLTINSIYSNQLAYCAADTNPGSRLTIAPDGGAVPYIITVLDTNDVMVREETSYSSYNFQGMPAGTYKIRVKDNCGTVVNSNSPHVIAPNIVYNFSVTTPTYWYWDNNVKVAHSGAGTICDPVTDAYYDFSYSGGIPVITGNDVFPISQVPGMTRMYAVEYDGVKTPYMTYNELIAYKQPLPLDINAWKPMTLWVSICGIEKSTIYNLPSRKNEFLPKLIANAGLTFYLADDKASTLCTPTGLVTLSRLSLLSGFCDPLTLTITEKNGVVPPKQYTITAANQNDFEAQLAIGNTYTFKLTDINGSELNRLSFVNVTRGQRINMYSRDEVFIDPASFRYYNQDELPFELASIADFKNFGKSQLGIKLDYYIPMPYTLAVTGPNGFYLEKTVNTMSYSGTLISDNLEVGDYSVHVTSATGCYDRTFTTTLDRVIDNISVTSTITPDPIACDRYVKTFNYKINNQGVLRPYVGTGFESMFKTPQIGFKVDEGPAGYSSGNAIIGGTYSWLMSSLGTATAAFRGDITGLYKISLVNYYTPTEVYGGPWELDVKSEFPVFDMNGSGGAICTGSTTGTLSVVVKNATAPVYYLKKATDTNYPAVGQSSSDFPNLTAGDYMVKVETACYPTALETSFKMDYISNLGDVIVGTNVLCDTDTLNLSIKSIGPVTNVEWKLPDGTTQSSNSLVLTNPQSGEYSVNITTRSGCIVADKIDVTINRRATAADITGVSQTICEGMGAEMLVLSSVTNPVFTWYSDAALTNVIATGENYGVTPTITTSYYVTVQGDGVCENAPNTAKEIVITVNPTPEIPTGDVVQSFCGAATIANLVTNETGVIWFTTATGGTAIPDNTPLVNGRTYYGELQSGICVSLSRLAVTVTINRFATAADISIIDQTICPGIGITIPPFTTISNPIFTWYDDATLTNAIGTSPIWLEPLVTTTYYITVKGDGVCENLPGTAKSFTIIVNPHPDTPTGDANQSFCGAATAADLVATGTNVEWYDSAEFGRSILPNTPLVDGTTYYAASHVYPLCESEIRLAVTVTIDNVTPPTGDTAQDFCAGATIANLVTNETGVIWFTAAMGGTAIPDNTPLINGRTYYGELQSGSCVSLSRLAVTVTINRNAVAADITGVFDFALCPGIFVEMLAQTTINNPVFTLYDDAALTNIIGTTAEIILGPLVTTTYYITVSGDGVCANTSATAKTITITVNPHPETPTGDANQSFCGAATGADLVAYGTNIRWYDSAEFGRFISSNTPLVNGTTYYAASHVYPLCESEIRLAVTVTIYPNLVVTPPTPQIAGNQCIFPDINFDSNNPGTLYVWSVDDWSIGLEDNWISSPNMPSFKAINTGTKPVTATVTVYPIGTVCGTGPFTFTITVNPDIILTKPTDKKICTNNIVSEIVFDSNITGTTYNWTNDNPRIGLAAVGTGNISAFTAINTGDSKEIATITVTPTAAGCTGIPVVFIIEVNPEGVIDKTENKKICVGETAVLTASSSTVINPVFTWYSDTALTDILGVGASFTTPVLTTDTIYYATVKGDNVCESSTGMPVMVTVNEALPPTGDAIQEFCLNENATVVDLVTNENNVVWYDAPIAGNVILAGTTLVNGTIYYGSLTVEACESTTRLAVTAIINDVRTPTGDATQEFCLNENAKVADLVTNENNVVWYDAPIAGNIISNKRALTHETIYYGSLRVGACENVVRLAVTAIIKTDLPGETIGWNTTACIGDEVTYRTTAAMSDYNWIVTGGIIKAGGQLNDDFVTVSWTTAGNGSIGVEFINVSNCNPIVTIHFPVTIAVCSDIAIGKVVNNPTPTIGENVIFTVTATNIGTGDFQNVSIDEMLPSGYTYVMATTTSGNYNSANGVWDVPVLTAGTTEILTLTAKVLETGDYLNIAYLKASTPTDPNQDNNRAEATVIPTGVIIYNAVSANGDGLNDYFKIEGLQHYPDNTVEIYNRWGVKIYEANGYGLNNNVFRGISDGRSTVKKGDIVPAGTYFYILRYKTNTASRIEKSGYLYIN